MFLQASFLGPVVWDTFQIEVTLLFFVQSWIFCLLADSEYCFLLFYAYYRLAFWACFVSLGTLLLEMVLLQLIVCMNQLSFVYITVIYSMFYSCFCSQLFIRLFEIEEALFLPVLGAFSVILALKSRSRRCFSRSRKIIMVQRKIFLPYVRVMVYMMSILRLGIYFVVVYIAQIYLFRYIFLRSSCWIQRIVTFWLYTFFLYYIQFIYRYSYPSSFRKDVYTFLQNIQFIFTQICIYSFSFPESCFIACSSLLIQLTILCYSSFRIFMHIRFSIPLRKVFDFPLDIYFGVVYLVYIYLFEYIFFVFHKKGSLYYVLMV